MPYQYWGFGLYISSQIAFPELLPCSFAEADISIQLGGIPGSITGNTVSNKFGSYTLGQQEMLFRITGVADYLAQNGTTILITPSEEVTEMRLVRLFVLATVMAAILTQREQLCIHASAVLHNNELVLLTGDSGAGKSTSLAGLMKKGHTIFSDDIVVMDTALSITASYPMIKLWEDAQEKLDHDLFDDQSFAIKPGMNKYGIFFHNHFDTGRYQAKKLLILRKGDTETIQCRQLMAAEAFNQVTQQVYRPLLLHTPALKALTFRIATGLVNSCEVYEITRPSVCRIEDLVEQVEKLFV